MLPISDSFEYEYQNCDLIYGRGRIHELGKYLESHDLERAMVICGSNVGANDRLMNMVGEGLGGRLEYVFDETTPQKRATVVFDAIDVIEEKNVDVLIGLGGGSSLDTARQASVFAQDDRSLADLRNEAREGEISPPGPDEAQLSVVVIPTTLAGADVSSGGSIEVLSVAESPTDQPVRVSGTAMPIADFLDPLLFETTPISALRGSAMNGFNKGLETPYARDADPISDAAAVHGLRLMSGSLPAMTEDRRTYHEGTLDRVVVGSLLVQIDGKSSLIHAFGHGFSRRYDLQQGAVHAVVAPHVLEYLLERVDASRTLLACGLGLDPREYSTAELGDAVVDAVADVRDSLDVPIRLRELPETRKAELPAVAELIQEDHLMPRTPAGIQPTAEEIEEVLYKAW